MKRISHGITDDELLYLLARDDPYIVECGAHDGRDTARFLKLFSKCRVVAFEPDPRPIHRSHPAGFLARVGNDPRVLLVDSAVGKKAGQAVLYRSSGTPPKQVVEDWDHSSSLRKPTGHLKWSPWCTFPEDKQIEVSIVSLDGWFNGSPNWSFGVPEHNAVDDRPFDLLWIDVQGGQTALINGAKQTLAKTRYVYIECHHKPMYDGEPLQDDLVNTFQQLGFEAIAIYEGYNLLFSAMGNR